MSSLILFVFEGRKLEPNVQESFQNYFSDDSRYIKCIYGTVIYKLYSEMKNDDSLDTLTLLKSSAEITDELEGVKVDDVSEIYFFFDYDGHASNASDIKMESLLNRFNDPWEEGKLYISYPMGESLKHYSDSMNFKELTFKISEGKTYKKLVNKECDNEFINIPMYSEDIWKKLVRVHLYKYNYIINDIYSAPEESDKVLPKVLFENQLSKYITVNNTVSVVSAFPIFLFDFFDYEYFKLNLLT